MAKLPRFFDWNGELGRYDFFIAGIGRGVCMALLIVINGGINSAFGWDIWNSETTFESLITEDPLITAGALVLFIPLYLRRVRDIGMSPWWVAGFEVLYLMPVPPEDNDYALQTYGLFSLIYIGWVLVLQFRPGRKYREFKRQEKETRGNSKVTFSE